MDADVGVCAAAPLRLDGRATATVHPAGAALLQQPLDAVRGVTCFALGVRAPRLPCGAEAAHTARHAQLAHESLVHDFGDDGRRDAHGARMADHVPARRAQSREGRARGAHTH